MFADNESLENTRHRVPARGHQRGVRICQIGKRLQGAKNPIGEVDDPPIELESGACGRGEMPLWFKVPGNDAAD